jgi:uncharacterized protein YeaO (DUF488 family)
MALRTKSVTSPIDPETDGLRILAARFRGRGLPKDRYDVWMANLGPSEALLSDFLEGRITHAQFKARYRHEILDTDKDEPDNTVIKNHGQKFTLRLLKVLAEKGNVTLMCHCPEDSRTCHRHALRELVERA